MFMTIVDNNLYASPLILITNATEESLVPKTIT